MKASQFYGYKDSAAERYALENGFTFIELSSPVEPTDPTEPVAQYKLGDTDEDGKVTILDATSIQRFLAGLPTHEGVGTTEKIIP